MAKTSSRNPNDDHADVTPRLEDELRALFQQTAPSAPPTEINALRRRATVPRPFFSRRNVKMSLRMTIAAVGIATVLTIAALWQSPDAAANCTFADVKKQMQETRTITYSRTDYNEEGQKNKTMTISILGPHLVRIATGESQWSLMDLEHERSMAVKPKEKKAVIFYGMPAPQQGGETLNLYQWLRTISDQAVSRLPARTIDGKDSPGFLVKRSVKSELLDKETTYTAKVWVNPKTKLPVRIEQGFEKSHPLIVLSDFQFDQPLDKDLFDFELPEGYEVTTFGVPKLAPPAKDETIQKPTITPRVGLGPAKFGMPQDEVIDVLGKPDKIMRLGEHGVTLEYYSRGYGLSVGDELGLVMITAFSQTSTAIGVRDFAGRTDKGIKIGSTKKEILAAYGEPSRVDDPKQPGRPTTLYYDDLGVWFGLWQGKVYRMVFPQPREDRRTRDKSHE